MPSSKSSQSFNPLSIDGPNPKKIIHKQRKNGFHSPFSIHIFITFGFSFLEMITFGAIICPYLVSEMGNLLGSLFISGITMAYLVILAMILLTMKKDPTDPLSEITKNSARLPKDVEYECLYCGSYVGENTKHCRDCNRCTKDFDHHCKWLNNCIGYNNYRYFFTLVALCSISGYLIISLCITIFIRAEELPYKNGIGVLKAYLVIFILAKAFITILISTLLGFHIYLCCKGKTTFEILRKKSQNIKNGSCQSKSNSEGESSQRRRIISDQSILPLKIPDEDDQGIKTYNVARCHLISPEDLMSESESSNAKKNFEKNVVKKKHKRSFSNSRISNYNEEVKDGSRLDISGLNNITKCER